MDKFFLNKFVRQINPKDGLSVSDCSDFTERRVLEFLISILHLEKPSQVIVTIDNTIFGSLSGEREVNWGVILHNIVGTLVSGTVKKPLPISSYLIHLYVQN